MVTELEKKLLDRIAHDEYTELNGSTPSNHNETTTWSNVEAWSYDLDITVNQVKGVLGSLTKKGFVWVQENYGEEVDYVGLTEEGFKIWKENS